MGTNTMSSKMKTTTKTTKCRTCLPPIIAVSLLTLFCPSGCIDIEQRPYVTGSDHYYINPQADFAGTAMVALIELENQSSYPHAARDITDALHQALQKRHLFALTIIGPSDPRCTTLQVQLDSPYTLEQLRDTHQALQCDAILLGKITTYRPYPNMSIALRLKLIDLKNGTLLWGLEQVWDANDKATQLRIKRYFETQMRQDHTPLAEQLVATSPMNFIKFVTWEVSETLAAANTR
jgi:hypothetical protein